MMLKMPNETFLMSTQYQLNSFLTPYPSCAHLTLAEIRSAFLAETGDGILAFKRQDREAARHSVVFGHAVGGAANLLVTVVTRPGGAAFEGTVRAWESHSRARLLPLHSGLEKPRIKT